MKKILLPLIIAAAFSAQAENKFQSPVAGAIHAAEDGLAVVLSGSSMKSF